MGDVGGGGGGERLQMRCHLGHLQLEDMPYQELIKMYLYHTQQLRKNTKLIVEHLWVGYWLKYTKTEQQT